MAHRTPAEVIGDASAGCAERQLTWIEPEATDSAYSPSVQGTNTVEPNTAVPPNAPPHTCLLASWPPMPPSPPAFNRYATPSLPTVTTSPDSRSAAPTDPRSTSPSLSARQLAGAKKDLTA